MPIKASIKSLMPSPLLRRLDRYRLMRDMKNSAGRSCREIFAEIYSKGRWGGVAGEYSSGVGSQDEVIAPYRDLVRSVIAVEGVARVVDLGCGDFNVGSSIVSPGIAYVGCDIFPQLIERNNVAFANDKVEFRVADIVADQLPEGDLCIIRQVFQHLPNADIARVLQKTRKYRLVLVTDEQVHGDHATINEDILPFHGTRRIFGHGLKLERAPFFQRVEVLLTHSAGSDYGNANGTYLRTVLLCNDPADQEA